MDKKQKTVNNGVGCAQKMYSFYVAECMEFKILGMEYRGLSLEEAVKRYRRIPSSKRAMIPGIGITIQTGDEKYPEDDCELIYGGCLDLDVLSLMPYAEHPLVKEAVEGLQRLMPELKVIAVRE